MSTSLKYKWNSNTDGAYKLFAVHIASSTVLIETHYRPKKGITVVMTTPLDLDDNDDGDEVDVRPTKEKLSGVHVIKLKVSGGKIYISY